MYDVIYVRTCIDMYLKRNTVSDDHAISKFIVIAKQDLFLYSVYKHSEVSEDFKIACRKRSSDTHVRSETVQTKRITV